MSAYKPVVLASLVATSVLTIGYLWIKHRQEESEQEEELSSPASPSSSTSVTDLHLDQVHQKLNCIKRSRLDTLEEEPAVSEQTQADTKDETVTENPSDNNSVANFKVHFASTDIRYRHLENQPSEQILENKVDTQSIIETAPIEKEETTKMAVEDAIKCSAPVPDVFSALNDPLCGSGGATPPSPNSFSSSPVKSESAHSKSSCEWSDLIEQDEKELQEFQLDSRELTCKLSGLELGSGRSNDSGVASPSDTGDTAETQETKAGTKSRTESGEDAGIGGSEQGDDACADGSLEDYQLLAYHFNIPEYLCGKLIGIEGTFINELKTECRVNIYLREISGENEKKKKKLKSRRQYDRRRYDEPTNKLCCIEGTRTNIDKCLNKLKKKFNTNTEVTFEQVNRSKGSHPITHHNGNVTLALAEGVMHDVFVSSIVGGGHVFLQQPCHPTYWALERLDQCMNNTYNQFNCPQVPQPIVLNSVCAAPCDGGWYRCQIVSYDEDTDTCDVKYLDYGGYASLAATSLKQIRTDFLSLPFQAIECYLANIQPQDDENVSALVLEELVSGQVVQARMIGTNEQGIPMVHLYRAVSGQTTMVNRELVDRNCAQWLDTTIVKLDSPLDHPSIM